MKRWTRQDVIAVVVALGSVASTAATIIYKAGGIESRLGRLETDVQSIRSYLLGDKPQTTRQVAGGR